MKEERASKQDSEDRKRFRFRRSLSHNMFLRGRKLENTFGLTEGTSLYCTVLYCTVLYCTVLYCTVRAVSCACSVQIVLNDERRETSV